MSTVEQQSTVQQNEKSPTLQNGVEVFQESQAVEEAIVSSKKDQDLLANEQDTKAEQKALAENVQTSNIGENLPTSTKPESKTLAQGVQVKESTEKTLSDATKTDSKTLEQASGGQEATRKRLYDEEIEKVQKITDSIVLKSIANKWIYKCENLLDGLKGNRKSKKELSDKVERAIKSDLKPMIEDNHIYETGLNHYKNRLGEIIYDYYNNREPARQIIMMGGRVPVIYGTVDTKSEAKRDNRYAKSNAEYQIDMSELKRNAAIYTLIGVNANEWGNYCDFIGHGGIATTHPTYIQHIPGFNDIKRYNPDLYNAIVPEKGGQITYNTYCQRNPQLYTQYCQSNNIVCRPRTFNNKIGKGLADMVEYFGGNKENDPRKRQAWEKAGSVVALGGTVVMGFLFFKNLFSSKKENKNKWGKVAGWGAGLLALTNRDTFTKWAEDILGWHPAEKTRMLAESFKTYGFSDEQAIEMTDRYIGAPVTTMSALHFIPIYELESQHILENQNGEFEFNYANYEKYVNQLRRTGNQKDQVLKAGKKLDKDKSVGAGLKAFGITTWEQLKSLYGSNKNKTLADTDEVKNGWGKMVEKVQHGVNKELYNNGLMIKNTEDVDGIMKEYDEQKDKIGTNELILKWMKEGLLEFNENKPYTMKAMLENPNIDLENMAIKGFKTGNNDVKFNSYSELFDTYFLTEKIKYKFEGVPAKSNEPFRISNSGQLKFDDKSWYEFFSGDTTVISKKAFTNDFPTLKENSEYYVNYLNERRQGKNGVDISSLDIVSQLGINFYSEKEAKELNATLKKIKNDLRFYHPTKYGDPFEIKNGVLKIKIQFTTVGESKKTWDISGLKTLSNEANQEKLLKYLNDKTNKMWGSSL